MIALPPLVSELVDELTTMAGTVAIVLGGSRANGSSDAKSDWDLGLYYLGDPDLSALRAHGDVHPPGAWGRLMNGGAWLTLGGDRVDVLLRDLDVVDHWTHRAEQGEFEVDALLGYIAGVPTYMLTGELASCVPLRGDAAAIEEVPYPRRLIERAPSIWRFCRSFSLEYARMHAKRGNRIGAIGQVSKAIMEEGHAVLSERGQWVCNEKRLIELADLSGVHDLFEHVPLEPSVLLHWVDLVAERVQRG